MTQDETDASKDFPVVVEVDGVQFRPDYILGQHGIYRTRLMVIFRIDRTFT